MTSVAEQTEAEKDAAIKARSEAMEKEEIALNANRTGKGTRVFLSMTRGRNPQKVQYENWDVSLPETLPTTLSEFMTLTGIDKMPGNTGEEAIVRRLILGDNELNYKEASDPIAEFVEASWPLDVQKQFKLVVRNYANATKVSIDDAVALIKPGIVKSQAPKTA